MHDVWRSSPIHPVFLKKSFHQHYHLLRKWSFSDFFYHSESANLHTESVTGGLGIEKGEYDNELTPCLRDVTTGDIAETEVVRIKRKSFLSKFNKNTGWYINWSKFPKEVEVYALVLKGTMDIQGLISISNDAPSNAVYVHWACTAPHNNVWEYHIQKYKGVGGHLLAIAAAKSAEWNHEGVFHSDAMDEAVLAHYVNEFGAWHMPLPNHPLHFVMEETAAQKIMEVYTYEWTDDEV